MNKILGLSIVLGLTAMPALAQKVTIDYAHHFDFNRVKTFGYVETKDSDSQDQLLDERIKSAIVQELTEGGLQQVDSGADLFVTYHVASTQNRLYSTTNFGYGGWGPGWGAWGAATGTATTRTAGYAEGTLVVDAYEPQQKRMVWRGTGTVPVKATQEKQNQQIDKILIKLGAKWEKILKNQGE